MYRTSFPYLLLSTAVFLASTSQAQNNRIESTGNVGMRTTSPIVKLTIAGPSDDSAAISLQSGGNSRFYIQQGGILLKIGGTTPGTGVINVTNTYKLGVNETIGAKRAKVEQDTWADFVFQLLLLANKKYNVCTY